MREMEAISTQYDQDQRGWTQEDGSGEEQWDWIEPEQDYDMFEDLVGDHDDDDDDDDDMLNRTRAALSRAQSSGGEVDILEAQLRMVQIQSAAN